MVQRECCLLQTTWAQGERWGTNRDHKSYHVQAECLSRKHRHDFVQQALSWRVKLGRCFSVPGSFHGALAFLSLVLRNSNGLTLKTCSWTFSHHKGNYSFIIKDFNLSGFSVLFPAPMPGAGDSWGWTQVLEPAWASQAIWCTCGGCPQAGARPQLLCARSVLTCRTWWSHGRLWCHWLPPSVSLELTLFIQLLAFVVSFPV